MNSFWDTPSCNDFLQKVTDDLWSGKIVLVYLPKHSPDNMKSAIKPIIGKGQSIRYDSISLNNCMSSSYRPIESMVFQHFELDKCSDNHIDKTASAIFTNILPDMNRVIIFENISFEIIGEFKNFLIDFSRYNLTKPVYTRHKALVIIDPSLFVYDVLPPEPGLSKLYFKSIFSPLDLSYALAFYLKYPKSSTKTLGESIIISLSKYDSRLCEHLSQSTDLLQDYNPQLLKYANDNQWNSIPFIPLEELNESEIWKRWAYGILEFEDKDVYYNSAYLAIHNQERLVDNVIWLSILKVLMPLIEEFRTILIESKKLIFPFKFQNFFGEVKSSKYEFEIGEISIMTKTKQIKFNNLSYNERIKISNFIELCRIIRNELSHLKIPKKTDIFTFMNSLPEMEVLLKT